MEKGTICVLDFNTGKIDLIKYNKLDMTQNEDFESYLRNLGYNLDEISYMVSNEGYLEICGYNEDKELMIYNKIF